MLLAESMCGKTTTVKKNTTSTNTTFSSIERRLHVSDSAGGQAGLYCIYVVQL